MTEEICTTQPSFFDDRAQRAIYAASNRAHSPINLHNQKRRALYRWCSRISVMFWNNLLISGSQY